jgi:hypothetical protein
MEWSPSFCLNCDKQTVDSQVYCSESCRLAEYEMSNSAASSPASATNPTWPSQRHGFYLPAAYDFSSKRSSLPARPESQPAVRPQLTPSSSQSSLFSMQSNASTSSEQSHLSEQAKKELRAYASSFDRSRYQRRQSAY